MEKLIYFLLAMLCVAFISTALHDQKLLDAVPWLISLTFVMIMASKKKLNE